MNPREWIRYNMLTDSYNTPDGTSVSALLVDSACCLADVLHIASIRAKQRAPDVPEADFGNMAGGE